jgi:hypothetical protein
MSCCTLLVNNKETLLKFGFYMSYFNDECGLISVRQSTYKGLLKGSCVPRQH